MIYLDRKKHIAKAKQRDSKHNDDVRTVISLISFFGPILLPIVHYIYKQWKENKLVDKIKRGEIRESDYVKEVVDQSIRNIKARIDVGGMSVEEIKKQTELMNGARKCKTFRQLLSYIPIKQVRELDIIFTRAKREAKAQLV